MKLLIVDDMKSFLDLERTFLRRTDCHIFCATTGLEALKVAQKVRPDLVVLDIEMPEMNGIETARIFSATPSLQDIPVVICSSTTRKDESLAAGAREFIQKPVDEERFLELVTRHVPLKMRKDPRKPLGRAGEIFVRGEMMPCSIADVSVSGVRLECSAFLTIGDPLQLRFFLPFEGGDKSIQAEGMVVRATPAGYGVGFSDISEGARLFIEEYVGE